MHSGSDKKHGGFAFKRKDRPRGARQVELDSYVKEKFNQRWLEAKKITAKHFVKWGKEYAGIHGMTNFKASHGWVWRFAIRERLSNRAVTTSGHTIPSDAKGNFEW